MRLPRGTKCTEIPGSSVKVERFGTKSHPVPAPLIEKPSVAKEEAVVAPNVPKDPIGGSGVGLGEGVGVGVGGGGVGDGVGLGVGSDPPQPASIAIPTEANAVRLVSLSIALPFAGGD